MLSGAVPGLIGTGPDIFSGLDLLKSLLKPSQLSSVDLSQITATSLSVCPSPSGSLGLRYHVKTRERRGSSFSQLGLEPNHTGLTAQSLFLEESCRVKRSDTQTFSNCSNYFKRVLKLQKMFFQLLQIKRLQLKLSNNLQNSYQISLQHQVPKTWVKQHPKTPKTTKTNENPSPSSSMHKLVPFGSYLVPIGSYGFYSSQIGSYKLKMVTYCSHAHALFQDRFKDVQVGSRWFSTLYILSPNFHSQSWVTHVGGPRI